MAESEGCADEDHIDFFYNLARELCYDMKVIEEEDYARVGAIMVFVPDENKWLVECHNPHAPLWGGDPGIIEKWTEYPEYIAKRVARIQAERDASDREKASKEAARSKRAAKLIGKPGRKRWRHHNSRLPPRTTVPKKATMHCQAEARDRCAAQDDDEEREEMEWLNSMEPSTSRPLHLRPLILQGIDSCKTTQHREDYGVQRISADDVD